MRVVGLCVLVMYNHNHRLFSGSRKSLCIILNTLILILVCFIIASRLVSHFFDHHCFFSSYIFCSGRQLENRSTAVVPVAGNALLAHRAAPPGSGVAASSSLIQPPKLDKFAEQVAANPLPDLMTPFGVSNDQLPVAGA